MALVFRPLVSRPAILARPLACSPIFHSIASTGLSPGAFSVSARTRLQAGSSNQASTALKVAVKDLEIDGGSRIVGEEGNGVEGPHYQDKIPLTPATVNSLTDAVGPWTLQNSIYTEEELDAVQIVGRTPVTFGDKLAHGAVKFFRRTFDVISGYKNTHISDEVVKMNPIPIDELRRKGELISDKQWLLRVILLESIAGVPGMVAATLRHLRSLRLLRRDGGWIHTLLQEAENERMHLLTFMTIYQPTIFTRFLVLGAQGMMYNLLFFTYLLAPKVAHRFVGALEEEAVRTYTHCISDIERGLVPEWKNVPAPQIAIDYWRLPASADLLDVIRAVRADEATHRFVNHSLANLDQKHDFNPFALGEASAEVRGSKPGFTREESAEFARQTQLALMKRTGSGKA